MIRSFFSLTTLAAVAFMSGCGAPPSSRTPAEQDALAQRAADSLLRWCVDPDRSVEAMAKTLSKEAGPGKASYLPLRRDGKLVGARLLNATAVGGAFVQEPDGTFRCRVATFAVAPAVFDGEVLDTLRREGFDVQEVSQDTYAVEGPEFSGTLVFSDGENSIGDVARSADLRF
ncbi:MAG: hypothetical protein AAGH68_00450 [Pseudomonadota bacterium]